MCEDAKLHVPHEKCETCGLVPDDYGNTEDDPIEFCCFPNCGCDGHRLCMAKQGPNTASFAWNLEKGKLPWERD